MLQGNLLRKSVRRWVGKKEKGKRNVVSIRGKKYSFSVSSERPECRQCYEDTSGFVTMFGNELFIYPVTDYDNYTVSRISPTFIKAYNVQVDVEDLIKV